MDDLAFLTLVLLIYHQIPYVLVEFYECRFLAKNKGQSYPLIQGAKVPSNHKPPHEHHMDWRAHKPQQTDVPQAQVINREHEGPLTSDPAQDEGSWRAGQVGRPCRSAEPTLAPPPRLLLRRGASPLDPQCPFRVIPMLPWPRSCWFPPINIKGGAPN